MRIFNINTEQEISPSIINKITLKERVIDEANKGNNIIQDILFNKSTTRSFLITKLNHQKIFFNNCKFRYINFDIANIEFNNCIFEKCNFIFLKDVKFNNCNGTKTSYFSCNGEYVILKGLIEIINTFGFDNTDNFKSDSIFELKIINSPDFQNLEIKYNKNQEKIKEQFELEQKREEKLASGDFIGYKIINVPYLVLLKFDKDTQFVNLIKSKSRANKAIVKDFIRLVEDKSTIVNYSHSDYLKYEIGKEVYPDSFDSDYREICGHGIHFCINPKDCYAHVNIDMSKDTYNNLIDNLIKNDNN